MKYLLAVLLLNCATVGYTNEQIADATIRCKAMCGSYGREFREWLQDGRCVCEGEKVTKQ